MTKDQETQILDQAIEALGDNSYLGPWLKSVRHEVVSNIRSDLTPAPTIKRAEEECEKMIEETRILCEEKIMDAQEQRGKIINEGRYEVVRQGRALREALTRLEGYLR